MSSNMSRRANKESVSSDSGTAGGVPPADIEVIVQNICHKAIEAAISVMKDEFIKLFEDHNVKLTAIEQRLQTIEVFTNKPGIRDFAVEDVARRLDHLESDITTQKNNSVSSTQITDILQEINGVRAESRSFMCAANDAEQYNRRNNLRIRGISLKPTDDCRSVVTSFIRDKLGVHAVDSNDIEEAHPLLVNQQHAASTTLQPSSQPTNSDVIIVRFRSRELRDTVIRMRRRLRGSRFTIAEDLTALNLKTLNRVRNDPDVAKSWTWNGKIFVITRSGSGNKAQVKPFQSLRE